MSEIDQLKKDLVKAPVHFMTEDLISLAEYLDELGYRKAPEPSEDMVEAVNQILQQLLNDWCSAGNGKRLILDTYARSILKLCQPELKVIKELRYFVANRGAGASTALESNAYSKVLEEIDELTHDQNQIKGE